MREFTYYPFREYGYMPSNGFKYDDGYWDSYRKRDGTSIGRILTKKRVEFVGDVDCVDIGIGGGAFVEAKQCLGHDVNPEAQTWLKNTGRWWDGIAKVQALTFWDALEHIQNPAIFLEKAEQFVFVSLPIFRDCEHMINSKHFKIDEHIHYWTDRGFKLYMANHGFSLIKESSMERDVGREDIGCYAFERI